MTSAPASEVINRANDLEKREDFYGPEEAELCYIRFYTELVLYSARLQEALIKQMLYCTDFREGDYQNATLGELLERNCRGCKPFPGKRHKITLLGSLAHRYGLCQGYEQCLNSHMNIVRQRRNLETAHSSIIEFRERTICESKELMATKITALGQVYRCARARDRTRADSSTSYCGSPHVELVGEPSLSCVLYRRLRWSSADYWNWTYRDHKDGFALVALTQLDVA